MAEKISITGEEKLRDITGQESGIVVYPNGDAIICNWDFGPLYGLPRIDPMGIALLGMGETLYVLEREEVADLAGHIDPERVIWDPNGDLDGIENTPATAYSVAVTDDGEESATVYAPHGWH